MEPYEKYGEHEARQSVSPRGRGASGRFAVELATRLVVVSATWMMSAQHSELDVVLQMARELTSSVPVVARMTRLLDAMGRLVPFDAACVLRPEGDELLPVAAQGLVDEALVQRYRRRAHPRLNAVLSSSAPVIFPSDGELTDPFDGFLERGPLASAPIRAALGCALIVDGEVVGVLTAQAVAAQAFDGVDPRMVAAVGALAAAALHTAKLANSVESASPDRVRGSRGTTDLQLANELVGRSPAVEALRAEISLVSGTDLPVLVTGETGVGKDLVAPLVHCGSRRAEQPLVAVNCAALPESIAESELFGHVKGAFTGAVTDRPGKFEVAHRGTLLLDEVGELPLVLQPKLLRALQQGEIQRVGSDQFHRVDVRVVAMTNRDLAREVAEGRFRADLYHRLAAYPLRVPPLRERREDIALLAAFFLNVWRRRLGLGPLRLSEAARVLLAAGDWPGNVRELENVVSRAVLRASRGRRQTEPLLVGTEHFALDVVGVVEVPHAAEPGAPLGPCRSLQQQTDDLQRRVISDAVERHRGNWAAAARELGLHRSNLYHRARRLGLKDSS